MTVYFFPPQSSAVNPALVTSPEDDSYKVIDVTLPSLEARTEWNMGKEKRLIELSKKINALVNPERMPSVFSFKLESFSQTYRNFNEHYREIHQIIATEINHDISEAMSVAENPLSADLREEAQHLLENSDLNILKSTKIIDIIHPNFFKFCKKNEVNLTNLRLYSKQLEYIHKVLTESGECEESIQKAIAELKRIGSRSTALYIASFCVAGLVGTATILGIYFGATAR